MFIEHTILASSLNSAKESWNSSKNCFYTFFLDKFFLTIQLWFTHYNWVSKFEFWNGLFLQVFLVISTHDTTFLLIITIVNLQIFQIQNRRIWQFQLLFLKKFYYWPIFGVSHTKSSGGSIKYWQSDQSELFDPEVLISSVGK